jgi:hypothetical protein
MAEGQAGRRPPTPWKTARRGKREEGERWEKKRGVHVGYDRRAPPARGVHVSETTLQNRWMVKRERF